MGLVAKLPAKCRLAPTVKHTGQKSGWIVRNFSNFDRFCSQNLQTMCANCFSFRGTSSSRPCCQASPLDLTRDFRPSDIWAIAPNENSLRRHCTHVLKLRSTAYNNASICITAMDIKSKNGDTPRRPPPKWNPRYRRSLYLLWCPKKWLHSVTFDNSSLTSRTISVFSNLSCFVA